MNEYRVSGVAPSYTAFNPILQERLAQCAQSRTFGAKRCITPGELKKYGEVVDIVSGQIRINLIGEEGQKLAVFDLRKNELAQWITSADQYLNDGFYMEICFCEETELRLISAADFDEIMTDDLQFRRAYYSSCAWAMSHALEMIGSLSFCSLEDRLQKKLVRASVDNGTNTVNITHEELAEELGTSREVISRLLSRMVKKGRIQVKRKQITLLDLEEKEQKETEL